MDTRIDGQTDTEVCLSVLLFANFEEPTPSETLIFSSRFDPRERAGKAATYTLLCISREIRVVGLRYVCEKPVHLLKGSPPPLLCPSTFSFWN